MTRLKGFTLIELLIVVAIIGILAAIAVPNFLNAQVRAKVSRVQSEHRSVTNALESFNIDNGQYPPLNWFDRAISRQCRGSTDLSCARIENRRPFRKYHLTTPISYIATIPFDPFRGDGGSDDYQYGSDGISYYIITSYGPDGTDGSGSEEFKEGFYSGANLNDEELPFKQGPSSWTLRDFVYDSSNGVSSPGDIFKVGP